ncbi:HNH endonuclease signature motif containing protein [Acidithrix sp. C25]|uniref:HNH endonuclease n=1 Tax=Acidithrix sp. C25 TaxID=1671482 RepID=UPI00191BAB0E|nr:HNH endonuclease signature motif containing protein [Acidithrix sp. C25]
MVIANRTEDERAFREEVFRHLDALAKFYPSGVLTSVEINSFEYRGRQIRLIVQSGIRKLQGSEAALTIRTTFTPLSKPPPYVDLTDNDGMIHYKYRGTDPGHSDNRALRMAMDERLPLAYFIGIGRGLYLPMYPMYILQEIAVQHEFIIGFSEALSLFNADSTYKEELQRSYINRITQARLHQPVFRARVLHAYETSCAICRLRHPELLDAAHIIPDGNVRGDPVVPNGLSLCKIHHAAYDNNFVGITPDGIVDVQERFMKETDGQMLLHGIQKVAGTKILLPRERAAKPDKDRLAERYEEFKRAS